MEPFKRSRDPPPKGSDMDQDEDTAFPANYAERDQAKALREQARAGGWESEERGGGRNGVMPGRIRRTTYDMRISDCSSYVWSSDLRCTNELPVHPQSRFLWLSIWDNVLYHTLMAIRWSRLNGPEIHRRKGAIWTRTRTRLSPTTMPSATRPRRCASRPARAACASRRILPAIRPTGCWSGSSAACSPILPRRCSRSSRTSSTWSRTTIYATSCYAGYWTGR